VCNILYNSVLYGTPVHFLVFYCSHVMYAHFKKLDCFSTECTYCTVHFSTLLESCTVQYSTVILSRIVLQYSAVQSSPLPYGIAIVSAKLFSEAS